MSWFLKIQCVYLSGQSSRLLLFISWSWAKDYNFKFENWDLSNLFDSWMNSIGNWSPIPMKSNTHIMSTFIIKYNKIDLYQSWSSVCFLFAKFIRFGRQRNALGKSLLTSPSLPIWFKDKWHENRPTELTEMRPTRESCYCLL